jgi:methylglutaconyl-CoA hydratase
MAMGQNAARRYFLTAERFSAKEAYRVGFVHSLAPASALDSTTDGIVNALVSNSSNAVNEAKRLVRDVAGVPLSESLIADTVNRIADIRASDEGQEGVRSFIEKRKPDWLG